MTDFVSGIESELSKSYQRIDEDQVQVRVPQTLPDFPSIVQNAHAGNVLVDQPQFIQSVHNQIPTQVPTQVHTPVPVQVAEVPRKRTTTTKMFRAKRAIRDIVNMTIVLLVLLLIGVVIYLTFLRYYLAADSFMHGNNWNAAALLSPELSSGLSTLALAL